MFDNKDKPFEFLFLNVTCLLGGLIIISRVINDFKLNYHTEFFALNLTINLLVLLVFISPVILSRFLTKFNTIGIPFCFAIIFLGSINWFLNGGIEASAEYNFIGLFFYISIILSGRWLYFFISILILDEIVMLYLWYNPLSFMPEIKLDNKEDPFSFISMVIAVTIGMLYLVFKIEEKKNKLRAEKASLSAKFLEMKDLNEQLRSYENELNDINHYLEQKVAKRVDEIEVQKSTINEYMNLSLREIKEPLKQALTSLSEICNHKEEKELIEMLEISGIELNETIENISKKLTEKSRN